MVGFKLSTDATYCLVCRLHPINFQISKGKQLFDGRCYFIFHHVRKIVAFLLLLMVALLEYRIVFCDC